MIEISFNFGHSRKASDIEQLNDLLSTMCLQDLSVEDTEGYLCTTRYGEGEICGRRYGLDRGIFRCKLARYQEGHYYRIDTFVEQLVTDSEQPIRQWRNTHPDRVVCYAMILEFDDAYGYVIIHHERG